MMKRPMPCCSTAEENLTVLSTDKFRTVVRRAYKILRPEGRDYGTLDNSFQLPQSKNHEHPRVVYPR